MNKMPRPSSNVILTSDLPLYHSPEEIASLTAYLEKQTWRAERTACVPANFCCDYYEYAEWWKEESTRIKLPKWLLSAISYMAYEQGHSGGAEEEQIIKASMEHDFLEAYKKAIESGEVPNPN